MSELSHRQSSPEISNLREPFRELAHQALKLGLDDAVNQLVTSLEELDTHRNMSTTTTNNVRPTPLRSTTTQTHDLFNNPIISSNVKPSLHNGTAPSPGVTTPLNLFNK